MTLELEDGRGELFQWDTGRIVELSEDGVSQVHFTSSEKVTNIPYSVEVKNRKAAIPDELLQTPGKLIAYAWVSDNQGGYTKVQVNFPVFARPKPSDYVYTPTEHAGFDRLRAEIGDLADLQTDAKDTLVAAINEAATSGGADWAQNDPNAKDYVKNRPGGYDVVTPEKIISERQLEAEYMNAPVELSEPLVVGRSYRCTLYKDASQSNKLFDDEVVAEAITDADSPNYGGIIVIMRGYGQIYQPATYPEKPALYSGNKLYEFAYFKLVAIAHTEIVGIPDKYTNAIKYTAQMLTDEQKKQARENVGAEELYNGMRKKELYYQLQSSDKKQPFVAFIEEGDITQFDDSEPDNSDIRKAFATLAAVLGGDFGVEYIDSDFKERTKQLYAAYQAGLLQLPLACYANPYYKKSQAVFIIYISSFFERLIVDVVYEDGSGFNYAYDPQQYKFADCTYTGSIMRVSTDQALTTPPSISQFSMSTDPTEDMQVSTKKYVDGGIYNLTYRLLLCPHILRAEQGSYGYWYIEGNTINDWYTKIKENPSEYPILCLYKGTYNIKYEYEGPLFLDSITDTEIVYKRTLEDGNWVGFKLSAVDGSPSKNGFIKGVSREIILSSSTADSTKKFKITVDDNGTLSAVEVTE